jgi:hypothetical protein
MRLTLAADPGSEAGHQPCSSPCVYSLVRRRGIVSNGTTSRNILRRSFGSAGLRRRSPMVTLTE